MEVLLEGERLSGAAKTDGSSRTIRIGENARELSDGEYLVFPL